MDEALEIVYLQNPPECIKNEIIRSYNKEDVEIKQYKYRSIGKKQLENINIHFDEEIVGQPKVKKQLISLVVPIIS